VLLGGVHARYADSISGTAALSSLQFSAANTNVAGTISGSLSRFSSGEWVTQLSGFGAAVVPVSGGFSLGLSAGGDGNRIQGGLWNGEASGGILGVLNGGRTMLTAGASLGTVTTINDSTFSTQILRARMQRRLNTEASMSGGLMAIFSDTVRYTDATLEFTYRGSGVRASVAGGYRFGDFEDDPWGQGHVECSMLPHLTFELTMGRYPQNMVGFTDGLYVTVGTRIGIAGGLRYSSELVPPVEITPLDGNRVRLAIRHSADAQTIEIVGGWNGWLPVPLEREGSHVWSAVLSLDPGIYKYAIVLDGGEWTVPDGVTAEPDDFGGVVATLVVKAVGRFYESDCQERTPS